MFVNFNNANIPQLYMGKSVLGESKKQSYWKETYSYLIFKLVYKLKKYVDE